MPKRKRNKNVTMHFDSTSQFVKWVNENWDTAKRRKECPDKRCSSLRDPGKSFYGGTYEDAVNLLQTGWSVGAKRVAELRASLEDSVQKVVSEKATQVFYDVEGEWADVGRIAAGDPDCCGSFNVQGDMAGEKIIRIVANLSVSSSVKHETMFARGAACVAAVDILESLGHRVELVAGEAGYCDKKNRKIFSYVTIKTADQPVDLDRLAFILCNPVWFRRVCFRWQEAIGSEACYTSPASFPQDDQSIILPGLRTGSVPSHQDTVREVIQICQLCGIELGESVCV